MSVCDTSSPRQAPPCSGCRQTLEVVPHGKWMNTYQWDATKAGDYFCKTCPETIGDGQASTGYAYFTYEGIERRRCAAPVPTTFASRKDDR